MKLLVFLGNIGAKYQQTRHNAGFLLGDFLQKKWEFSEWEKIPKLFGEISKGNYKDEPALFLKPHTLMNLSGKSLLAVKNFYKIELNDILLCYDDKDLEFGTVRFREKGSAGGHNGVKDCIRVLGTDEIKRVKVGVDTEERQIFAETADFVLGKFHEEEWEKLPSIFTEAETKILIVF